MTGPEWFIVAPPYTHASAGVVVLHRLCHKLRQLGLDTRMSTPGVNPAWDTPYCETPAADSVVVYPESIGGNRYGARRAVRWVLYYPGRIGDGTATYDPREMVVYYDERYRVGPGPVVTLSPIDATLFFDTGAPKQHDVMWVYKGDRTAAPWPSGHVVVITPRWPESRGATATLLRGARRLYSYDTCTSLITEATMCGADVMVPEAGRWARHRAEPLPFDWHDLSETRRLIRLAQAWFRLG
jgi:hypothetical protein